MTKNRIALYVVKGLMAVFVLIMFALFGWFVYLTVKGRM